MQIRPWLEPWTGVTAPGAGAGSNGQAEQTAMGPHGLLGTSAGTSHLEAKGGY